MGIYLAACRSTRPLLATSIVLGVLCCASSPALASDTAADRVLGQIAFAYDAENMTDSRGLRSPAAVALDRSVTPNRVYVADSSNNRVLAWTDAAAFANGAPADFVIGQPDFFSFACNAGGVSASSLCGPRGVTVDAAGNLYVADDDNNRLLEYDTPLATDAIADRVFGQGGSFTTNTCNAGGVSASSLCGPRGITVDAAGNLYVADDNNSRVLQYDTPLTTDAAADRVFGQGGSFTTHACSNGGVSASTLCGPDGVAVDGAGNLYIADTPNNRVLEYDTPLASDTAADRVFGQSGSFTTNLCNGVTEPGTGTPTANRLCNPTDVVVDAAGNVYVADWANSRVLEYNTPLAGDTTADRVFGQAGFTFGDQFCNSGLATGTSSSRLCNPSSVALDGTGNLYVAESGNHRVLKYNAPLSPFGGTSADRVLGQVGLTYDGANLVDARSLSTPSAVAIDGSVTPHRIYVADLDNNRVLAWANEAAFMDGDPADLVIGQPDFFSSGCNTGGRSANSLCVPIGVAVDAAGNVYVSDGNNRRVLEYDTPFTSGTTADRLFGQASFTAPPPSCTTSGVSAASMCNPGGVAVDQLGNLYVADPTYDRVLEYDTPLAGAGDTIADRVFGQGSLTATGCNNGGLSASSLCAPSRVAVDDTGNLYVSDASNHRVLEYDAPLTSDTTADRVFGQGGSFTTNTCGALSAHSLCSPSGIAVDGAHALYIAQSGNNRVVRYNAPLASSTAAELVFGQGGDFTTNGCNAGGVSASSLCSPRGLTVDGAGDLYVADGDNNRVLEFTAPDTLCGNGMIDSGEACDDGNLVAGDCCSAVCQLEPAGSPCRSSEGECDPAESCTGTASTCPGDVRAPAGTACSTDGNPCTLDQCDGTSATCQHPAGNAGTTCRLAAGVCDLAETCDGTSTDCPPDAVAPSTTVCRATAGPCDAPETCDGAGVACPPDALEAATTVCRAAAGECDTAESCTGTSTTCPADAKSTAVCRGAAGECDVAESCDGSSDSCPADVLQPVGFTCRPVAGVCDEADVCTGVDADCPPDIALPDGTSCDDANICTTLDTCYGGTCVGNPNLTCSDHYLCYKSRTSGFVPPPPALLVDPFEQAIATIGKPKLLCTAADKNVEGVIDPDTHERAYAFKQAPRHAKRTVTTVDQFGTLSLTTKKADLLFVPTSTDFVSSPTEPDLNAIEVNHYKCYRVKVTAGTPKLPSGIQVLVTDQFTPSQKRFDVRKPRHLCTAVDKNGEGVPNPDANLVCYQVKPASGEPKHILRTVFTNNQFAPETVTTLKEDTLCVPALVTP